MRRVMADAGDGLSFGEALLSQPSETPRQPAPADIGPVLVTGASGFVGSAVAAAFRAAGYPVRALVRASSPRTNLQDLAVEVAEGDLRDRASVAAALKGVRYLVHAAADYRLWAPDPEEIVRTNVEGTRILMQEALPRRRRAHRLYEQRRDARARRDGLPGDETRPLAAGGRHRRLQAQQGPGRAAGRGDGRAGRPAGGDRQSLDADRAARRQADADRPHHRRGRARAGCRRFVDTGLNLVHVDDVAAGHLAALRARARRRALHPGRRERAPAENAGGHRRAWSAARRRGCELPAHR